MKLNRICDNFIKYSVVEELFDVEKGSYEDPIVLYEADSYNEAVDYLQNKFDYRPSYSRTKDSQVWYDSRTPNIDGFWFTNSFGNIEALYIKSSMTGISQRTSEELNRIPTLSLKEGISDSLAPDMSIVFHSTRSGEELQEVILKKKFRAGSNGGCMLGPGFYANQHLYQAKKGNYGKYILKARILGIKKFIFFNYEAYKSVHPNTTLTKFNYLTEQFGDSKLEEDIKKWISKSYHDENRADSASNLWNRFGSKLKKQFGGIVYTGGFDKESVVCWFPDKQVLPLAWSDDKGETWKPLKQVAELLSEEKKENLNGAEALRSTQRALDLIKKYENHSDDKLVNAIKSHLSRITDPSKKENRKLAFVEVLQNKRPSVVNAVQDLEI